MLDTMLENVKSNMHYVFAIAHTYQFVPIYDLRGCINYLLNKIIF